MKENTKFWPESIIVLAVIIVWILGRPLKPNGRP
jgi:hypothetical protein